MRASQIRLDNMPRIFPRGVLPMPADLLDCAPESAGLSSFYRGPLLALCLAFWRGGCELRGVTCDADLMAISGLHTRRWQTMRLPLLQAFEALRPILSTVYARQAGLATARTTRAAHARLSIDYHAKRKPKLSDRSSDVAPLLPRKDTEFRENKSKRVVRGVAASLIDGAE